MCIQEDQKKQTWEKGKGKASDWHGEDEKPQCGGESQENGRAGEPGRRGLQTFTKGNFRVVEKHPSVWHQERVRLTMNKGPVT